MAVEYKRLVVRKGNKSDLVVTDLLPGELALALDTNEIGIKTSGGNMLWFATKSINTNVIPMSQGGTGASTTAGALEKLGLITYPVISGTNWELIRFGNVMELRLYNAKASDVPAINSLYRPINVAATGFAWILGSSPQAGFLSVSSYDGSVNSYVMSGPNASSTECRGTVMWIIG